MAELEFLVERLNLQYELAKYDPSKRLRNREKEYCTITLNTHGFLLIKETDEGWWIESHDIEKNIEKQMDKYKNDPMVSSAFLNTPRFGGNGGWE